MGELQYEDTKDSAICCGRTYGNGASSFLRRRFARARYGYIHRYRHGFGEVAGTLTIERSADDGTVTSYTVYWGSSANQKLAGQDALAEAEVGADNVITVEIPENTAIPEGATHVLAFVKSGEEESEEFEAAEIVDLGSTVTITLEHSLPDIESFDLAVSGDDMDNVTASVDGSASEIVAEVPDGSGRIFTVTAAVDGSSSGAALTFTGTAVEDLTAGEPTAFDLPVDTLGSTKIVIPDYLQSRLVQIDDMNGGNWEDLMASAVNPDWVADSYFLPYDVDFDNQGRIYVANYSSQADGIVRIDDISGFGAYEFTTTFSYAKAIAVDRENGILYYAAAIDGDFIYEVSLADTGHAQVSISGISGSPQFNGLAVDDDGNLYIAGSANIDNTDYVLVKYNPVTGTVAAGYEDADGDVEVAWDVIVKGDRVYMTNYTTELTANQIMQFDTDLNLLDSFGDTAGDPSDPGDSEFLGPHRFVAILNEKITVTDEYEYDYSTTDRLVSFDDLDGSGWDSFDPSEVSESVFSFFEDY